MHIVYDIQPVLVRLGATLDCRAFLAGGAVRDQAHGRFIKDYDIFVPAAALDAVDFASLAPALGPGWAFDHFVPDEYFKGNMAEECGPIAMFVHEDLFSFDKDYVPPIQLIGLKTRGGQEWGCEAVLNRIDIGLCRALMDDKGLLHTAPEFHSDSRNKTITIVDKRDPERSLKRAQRIQEKYPEFTIVP